MSTPDWASKVTHLDVIRLFAIDILAEEGGPQSDWPPLPIEPSRGRP